MTSVGQALSGLGLLRGNPGNMLFGEAIARTAFNEKVISQDVGKDIQPRQLIRLVARYRIDVILHNFVETRLMQPVRLAQEQAKKSRKTHCFYCRIVSFGCGL